MSQSEIYKNAGFGHSVPRGTRPAIVVVDFTYGFTDRQYPTASDAAAQMAATRELTDLARHKGIPVIYTVIAFHPGEVETLAWLRKSKGLAALVEGSRLVEIDA
ncbi:isochorismatase family protein, partial [Pelagibacterium lacus]